MAILLGIDTGGTYTDAALFDDVTGEVRSAKALTTKHDLTRGIRAAVEAVLPSPPPEIALVSLSTTLATNALVEGQGSPIGLLLIGYPEDVLDQEGLREALNGNPVAFINGGHQVNGEEQMPLDLDAARAAIQAHAPSVAAFAVSGYFAVRNPAHELAVRALIREQTGLPVTCGHELTSNLHAPRRALTTALNARLIPLLQQLILAVRQMLAEKSIHAPLMVVKGDGSLVDAQVALERPVETILSGPAASVVGAHHLSGEAEVFVVDMGGTTTDIALLREGRPVLNPDGAMVGGWRTMVEAVAVHTFGLGGDSEVRLEERDRLVIGPRRVMPLSLLAHEHPPVLEALRRQLARPEPEPTDGQFVLRLRPLERQTLSPAQQEVWDALATGPLALEDLLRGASIPFFRNLAVTELAEAGLVLVSGFTPSDAAHVLGHQQHWSQEAARLGAALWARRVDPSADGMAPAPEAFCRQVMEQMTIQAGRAVVTAALAGNGHAAPLKALPTHAAAPAEAAGNGALCRFFVDQALAGKSGDDALVEAALTLRRPLVAVGAPVPTFYPPVAERLHTRLCIPAHAHVANAVGAGAGGVTPTVRALIKPTDQGYRVHLPTGIRDFADREEATAWAEQEASVQAEAQARRAGAVAVRLQVRHQEHIAHTKDGEVYVDAEVVATAAGRPRRAHG